MRRKMCSDGKSETDKKAYLTKRYDKVPDDKGKMFCGSDRYFAPFWAHF